jgi:hypothetical protein
LPPIHVPPDVSAVHPTVLDQLFDSRNRMGLPGMLHRWAGQLVCCCAMLVYAELWFQNCNHCTLHAGSAPCAHVHRVWGV